MPRSTRHVLASVPGIVQGLYASCPGSGACSTSHPGAATLYAALSRAGLRSILPTSLLAGQAVASLCSTSLECTGLRVQRPVLSSTASARSVSPIAACSGTVRLRHGLAWRQGPVNPVDIQEMHRVLGSITVLEDAVVPILSNGQYMDLGLTVKVLQKLPGIVAAQSLRQAGSPEAAVASFVGVKAVLPVKRLGRSVAARGALGVANTQACGALLPDQQRMLEAVVTVLARRLAADVGRCTDTQLVHSLWALGVCRLRFGAQVPSDALATLSAALTSRAAALPLPRLATATWALAAACHKDDALLHVVVARVHSGHYTAPATATPGQVAASSSGKAGSQHAGHHVSASKRLEQDALEPRTVAKLAAAFHAFGVKDAGALGALSRAATDALLSQLAAHDAALGPLTPRARYRYRTIKGWVVRDTPPNLRPSKYLHDNTPKTQATDFEPATLVPTLRALASLSAPGLEPLLAAARRQILASQLLPVRAQLTPPAFLPPSAASASLTAGTGAGPRAPPGANAAALVGAESALAWLVGRGKPDGALAAHLLSASVDAYSVAGDSIQDVRSLPTWITPTGAPPMGYTQDSAPAPHLYEPAAFKGRDGKPGALSEGKRGLAASLALAAGPGHVHDLLPRKARAASAGQGAGGDVPTPRPAVEVTRGQVAQAQQLIRVLDLATQAGANTVHAPVRAALGRVASYLSSRQRAGALSPTDLAAAAASVVRARVNRGPGITVLDSIARELMTRLHPAAGVASAPGGAALARLSAAFAAARTKGSGKEGGYRYPTLLSELQGAAQRAHAAGQLSAAEAHAVGKALAKWPGRDERTASKLLAA